MDEGFDKLVQLFMGLTLTACGALVVYNSFKLRKFEN